MTFVCFVSCFVSWRHETQTWRAVAVGSCEGSLMGITDSTSENPEWVSLPSLLHDHHGYLLATPRGEPRLGSMVYLLQMNLGAHLWVNTFKMKEPTWKITPKKCTFKITFPSLALLRKKWVGGGIKSHV